ncbi:MAG: aminodeoxychorismate/anthranilate synthase component II [Desulfobacterales bacterium]|nr:aminodeoxychorismate/anthranilate synthase component II [Desulfobacterales bacterium]
MLTKKPKLLVLDNYDSFTYNLVQMFMLYNLSIDIYRNNKITLDQVEGINPDYILISPGPKNPAHTGISISLIKEYCEKIPILGVCLGMQCINEVFGGKTIRDPLPMHGKTSKITHESQGVFSGIPSPFTAARYHSLMVKPPIKDLLVTATADDGVIMGLSHKDLPLHGVQFHPESFLTENGFILIENFLKLGPHKNSLIRNNLVKTCS